MYILIFSLAGETYFCTQKQEDIACSQKNMGKRKNKMKNRCLNNVRRSPQLSVSKSVPEVNEPEELKCGMFVAKTANQAVREAVETPNPEKLWHEFWYEGELCCLFADTNLGKSILAVQICTDIARLGRKVVYFDFELSDKQFQLRYTVDGTKATYIFPENFLRVKTDDTKPSSMDDLGRVTNNLEQLILQAKSRIVVIDNLSWLCAGDDKGSSAFALIGKLIELKRKHGLSILVLAHTPKRNQRKPITQNDLAGSKQLINFVDSAFAIGQSARDESIKYLKQIKVRTGELTYGSDNIVICSIEKDVSYLRFVKQGYAAEIEHLGKQSREDLEKQIVAVKALSSQGLSIRAIAQKLGLSKSKVDRLLKRQ